MQCPKCQHEIEVNDRFCRTCGEKLPSVCPDCGHEIRPDDRFCASCGSRLVGTEHTPSEIERRNTVSGSWGIRQEGSVLTGILS